MHEGPRSEAMLSACMVVLLQGGQAVFIDGKISKEQKTPLLCSRV